MAALDGARQLDEARRAILRRGTAVAAPVAAFVSAYFAVWQPSYHFESWVHGLVVNVAESLAYLVVILVVGNLLLRYFLGRHRDWVTGRRPIDDSDKDDLVYLPVRLSTYVFISNAVIVALAAGGDAITGATALQLVGYAVGFSLAGFTFAAIVYLQTERALRPIYGMAFATSLPRRRTVGVLPRLLITWGVGSGVPLLFVALIPLRGSWPHQPPIVAPMLFMAIGGLLVGAVTTVLAARSVADPVESVRSGLERVRDGDLEVAVEVARPGALGALQAGFNDMVDAMRTRQRLEDLFGRQVGEEVARQAIEVGAELGGELAPASVLFVDLIGSSALAERRSPSEVVGVLNTMFGAVVAEVSAQGGWVNKFEGDGCLCVFGPPQRSADHAAQALRAARLLGARLTAMGIDAGIGVSSGEVVAGNVGTTTRFEYTVIGRPVNQASRLTGAAKGVAERVLASMDSVRRAGTEAANWSRHGTIDLKGFRSAVDIAVPVPSEVAVG